MTVERRDGLVMIQFPMSDDPKLEAARMMWQKGYRASVFYDEESDKLNLAFTDVSIADGDEAAEWPGVAYVSLPALDAMVQKSPSVT